ncbi:MAG: hypothetical protein HC844_21790, partial [Tabrizicola sp.]|nr:hypothetical protein [Tabrizicola sp.]
RRAKRRPGTDLVWRPDLWSGPVPATGVAAAPAKVRISGHVTIFHDCTESTLTLRQIRNPVDADAAPFGLRMDAFDFDGTFLSMAIDLPDDAAAGLSPRHIVQFDAVLEQEREVEVFARLNVKHGPNMEQLVQNLSRSGAAVTAEFDLAYARIDMTRIERAWLDVIFGKPAMNQITLRDATVSRRTRAEI